MDEYKYQHGPTDEKSEVALETGHCHIKYELKQSDAPGLGRKYEAHEIMVAMLLQSAAMKK